MVIGEEFGVVDSMFSKIVIIYEVEVDDMVDGLISLFEFIIMVVLGVVIGGLIVVMYLFIFEMGNVVWIIRLLFWLDELKIWLCCISFFCYYN